MLRRAGAPVAGDLLRIGIEPRRGYFIECRIGDELCLLRRPQPVLIRRIGARRQKADDAHVEEAVEIEIDHFEPVVSNSDRHTGFNRRKTLKRSCFAFGANIDAVENLRTRRFATMPIE